jgi:hypothetical protein
VFSPHFDITFFPNRIRITDARKGRTLERSADSPFSSEHRMLAEPEDAAKFLNGLLREFSRGQSFLMWPTASVKIAEGQDSRLDREEVRKLVVDQGFRRVDLD